MPPLLFVTALAPSLRARGRAPACPPARRRPPAACDARPVAPSTDDIDAHFARLRHVNPNQRKKASAALAAAADARTVDRLVALLDRDDTAHRRAAVQALGMTGARVVPSVVRLLRESPNSTVRASCAKVLAAVALYFPEQRAGFPADALDALEAALESDPDPVTKLATVGCLGTLGSDVKGKTEVTEGCERAVHVLLKLCGNTSDMAVGATAVGAIAQIGQNGSPQRKARIVEQLTKLAQGDATDGDLETGFNYIREMAASHLDQLQGGPRVPDE